MNVLYYLRSCIYTVLVSIMVSGSKKGIIAWRISSLFAFADLALIFFAQESAENGIFTFMLLIQCFISMPFLSQLSTCKFCGKRTYYHSLYSNSCQYCGRKIT